MLMGGLEDAFPSLCGNAVAAPAGPNASRNRQAMIPAQATNAPSGPGSVATKAAVGNGGSAAGIRQPRSRGTRPQPRSHAIGRASPRNQPGAADQADAIAQSQAMLPSVVPIRVPTSPARSPPRRAAPRIIVIPSASVTIPPAAARWIRPSTAQAGQTGRSPDACSHSSPVSIPVDAPAVANPAIAAGSPSVGTSARHSGRPAPSARARGQISRQQSDRNAQPLRQAARQRSSCDGSSAGREGRIRMLFR